MEKFTLLTVEEIQEQLADEDVETKPAVAGDFPTRHGMYTTRTSPISTPHHQKIACIMPLPGPHKAYE